MMKIIIQSIVFTILSIFIVNANASSAGPVKPDCDSDEFVCIGDWYLVKGSFTPEQASKLCISFPSPSELARGGRNFRGSVSNVNAIFPDQVSAWAWYVNRRRISRLDMNSVTEITNILCSVNLTPKSKQLHEFSDNPVSLAEFLGRPAQTNIISNVTTPPIKQEFSLDDVSYAQLKKYSFHDIYVGMSFEDIKALVTLPVNAVSSAKNTPLEICIGEFKRQPGLNFEDFSEEEKNFCQQQYGNKKKHLRSFQAFLKTGENVNFSLDSNDTVSAYKTSKRFEGITSLDQLSAALNEKWGEVIRTGSYRAVGRDSGIELLYVWVGNVVKVRAGVYFENQQTGTIAVDVFDYRQMKQYELAIKNGIESGTAKIIKDVVSRNKPSISF